MPFAYRDCVLSVISKESENESAIPLEHWIQPSALPFYIYDGDEVLRRAHFFRQSTSARVHYAMKANSNRFLLKELAKSGIGVDVVSRGEIDRALECGFPPDRIIYSGVAKSKDDLKYAIARELFQINVESLPELRRLQEITAGTQRPTRIALRLNLAMDVPTHPYIQTSAVRSKFGIPLSQLDEALNLIAQVPTLSLQGYSVHVGSQIHDLRVFEATARLMRELYEAASIKGLDFKTLDIGGGLGIDYESDADDFDRIRSYLEIAENAVKDTPYQLLLEPGRILVGKSGALLARVEYVKPTTDVTFLILNSGIHHLMRPALYQAFHRIVPLRQDPARPEKVYDVVGPLCESSDCFAKDRHMPELRENEWVAILDAGAYGHVMASTYNESPWPREVFVLNQKSYESEKITTLKDG